MSSNANEFIITASIDGHVKFWKKAYHLVDFAKHYRAHAGITPLTHSIGRISGIALSRNGQKLCTCSNADRACKIYDVINTDMIHMMKLSFPPSVCQFIHAQNDLTPILAIAE